MRAWDHGGWSDEPTVGRSCSRQLTVPGDVLVSRRTNGTRWWDIGERCLPPGALDDPAGELPEDEVVRRAAVRAVRALGAATPTHINRHFTRNRYPHLTDRLAELVADDELVPVGVEGLKGRWYVHADDLADVDDLAPARLTLLSPFDNLICDRDRTEALWDFRYRIEIYTPVAKREYGYYVLPVLDGDRLVGPHRRRPRLPDQPAGGPVGAPRAGRASVGRSHRPHPPPLRGPGPLRRRRRHRRRHLRPLLTPTCRRSPRPDHPNWWPVASRDHGPPVRDPRGGGTPGWQKRTGQER